MTDKFKDQDSMLPAATNDKKKAIVAKTGGKTQVIINPPEKVDPQRGYNEQFKQALEKHSVIIEKKTELVLQSKAIRAELPQNVVEQVYKRGFKSLPLNTELTREQYAMNRVNSFVAGGAAMVEDCDLLPIMERMGMKGTGGAMRPHIKREKSVYNNKIVFHVVDAKGNIKHSTNDEFEAKKHLAQKYNAYMGESTLSPMKRFEGTKSLVKTYKDDTPGEGKQSVAEGAIKDVEAKIKAHDQRKANREQAGDPYVAHELHSHNVIRKQLLDKRKKAQAEYHKRMDQQDVSESSKPTKKEYLKKLGQNRKDIEDTRQKGVYGAPGSLKNVDWVKKKGVASGSLNELKKSTVKSYADKKQAELDDVPPMPFKKPAMSKAEHEKAAKGMTGALARLSGQKPTSQGVAEGLTEMDKSQTPPGRDGGTQFPPGPKVSKKDKEAVKKDPVKHLSDLFAKEYAKKKKGVAEETKKGLYYYVNRRKKLGISRDKDSEKAPSAQDWKNAAKTAKEEVEQVNEFHYDPGMGGLAAPIVGAIATSKAVQHAHSWIKDKLAARKVKKNNPHVKEEVEQINELSQKTLTSYVKKVANDAMKHRMDPTKRSPEKASKSVAGFAKALNRLPAPKEPFFKEEATLSELSNEVLARYKAKAGEQASAADKAGDFKKGNKRFSGIIKATNKQFNNDAKGNK